MKTKRRLKADMLWALYKGDDFLAVGNFQELSDITGLTVKHIAWLSTPCGKNATYEKENNTYIQFVSEE